MKGTVPESTGTDYSMQHQMVIDYIIENWKITTRNVEGVFQVKDSMARRILREMREKKILQKRGSGKNTYYVLG